MSGNAFLFVLEQVECGGTVIHLGGSAPRPSSDSIFAFFNVSFDSNNAFGVGRGKPYLIALDTCSKKAD